ncbi:maleylpyruvate isomerase family mycothiol-dependent enzyme [Actinomadura viridis]|uniref:Uncharacterized protein (TIGR03083 family) n=1 Tax=Actinomadura viridis TaxID=58110 RepID=A0A931GKV7_9ACTN|nr:maleylpyruvate isomerase family mycothiol-dependent enzyme [Actinomadura viridis]MBG6090515.1 uncharacterized protein (TIGR03083 family) [Actinomadura viridis]
MSARPVPSGTPLPARRLAAGLREQTGAFAAAVDGADPGATVPTCPEWTVRDLVEHVGGAHRWAGRQVAGRLQGPEPLQPAEKTDPADWGEWLRAGADALAEACLREAGTEVWTFLGPRSALFWLRRLMADTAVHNADASLAAGRPYSIAGDLAADTLTEGLELLSLPDAAERRPALAELRGDGETLRFQPAGTEGRDEGDGWLITRTPRGVAWERAATGGDVVVRGPVADLLLVFSRRSAPAGARVEVEGERGVLDHWLAHTAF